MTSTYRIGVYRHQDGRIGFDLLTADGKPIVTGMTLPREVDVEGVTLPERESRASAAVSQPTAAMCGELRDAIEAMLLASDEAGGRDAIHAAAAKVGAFIDYREGAGNSVVWRPPGGRDSTMANKASVHVPANTCLEGKAKDVAWARGRLWAWLTLREAFTVRTPSPHHLQVLCDGTLAAEWWPSTGKTSQPHPVTGKPSAGPTCATPEAFIAWLES